MVSTEQLSQYVIVSTLAASYLCECHAGGAQQAESAQLADQVCGFLGGCQAVIGTGDNFYECVRAASLPKPYVFTLNKNNPRK